MRFALFALLLAAVFGCDPLKSSDPVGAYSAFLRVLERGETERAFKALSKRTRDRLEAQAKAASQASGGTIEAEPSQLAFPLAGRPGNVSDIQLLRREGDSAVLQVTINGQKQELTMVLEDGSWRIDA